ncbi:hypothetical protein [Conexibacter arvalis]|uniref:Uncharacterized protein n=1 Tax=Conexibacter arvalis TaxID=912552 RepID=A0A840ICV3_9ACTN|nr:hypothetical protein [Conexibacter arvalis]MBB4662656.1 hypothetical protein [Conexibacter arvalis]
MDPEFAPYLIGIVVGFAVGGFGHLIKSNALIATGIGIIFLVAVLMPLLRVGE